MPAELEMAIEGEDTSAVVVLRAATATLKLIREIERDVTGKPPRIRWMVDIFSRHSTAHVRFRTQGGELTTGSPVLAAIAERLPASKQKGASKE